MPGPAADYDSVIGMDKAEPLQRFLRKISSQRYTPATGPATVCGVFVQTGKGGLATRIEPVRVGGRLNRTLLPMAGSPMTALRPTPRSAAPPSRRRSSVIGTKSGARLGGRSA